jgi:hypothetical protein
VFCADTLEPVVIFLAVEAAQWIPAQNAYIVRLGHHVAELFDPNCSIRFPFRPQEADAFTA